MISVDLYTRTNRRTKSVQLNVPNEETVKAIKEGERLLQDPATKRYSDIQSLRKALGV